jgi:hypothetical protein
VVIMGSDEGLMIVCAGERPMVGDADRNVFEEERFGATPEEERGDRIFSVCLPGDPTEKSNFTFRSGVNVKVGEYSVLGEYIDAL